MLDLSTRAPTRIDLAGGTLDIWPLHQLLRHKACINVAIDLWAEVELEQASRYSVYSIDQNVKVEGSYEEVCAQTTLPLFSLLLRAFWAPHLPPISLSARALSPKGAGIGGSSCLAIATAFALVQARARCEEYVLPSEAQLVATAGSIEAQLIHSPTGVQDYWAAVRGGLNILEFPSTGTTVRTVPLKHAPLAMEELLLVYCGTSRDSAINNWELFKRAFERDVRTLGLFNEIGSIAEQMVVSIEQGDSAQLLALSQREWQLRKQLWPGIETAETRALDTLGQKAGATFSRLCGAGGGGVMLFFVPASKREALAAALSASELLRQAGGRVLNAGLTDQGLRLL